MSIYYTLRFYSVMSKKRKSSCLFGFEESAKTIKEFEKDLDKVLAASDKSSYSDQEKVLALQDTSILYFMRTFFALIKALLSPKDRLTRHCFDRNIYRDALISKSMVSLTVFPLAGFAGWSRNILTKIRISSLFDASFTLFATAIAFIAALIHTCTRAPWK